MKQKLLNNFKLRALMLVAILCAAFTGTAWGETVTLVSGSGTSGYVVPEGWTTSGTVEGGSYLKFDNGTITSPEFDPHTGLSFTYTVATFGSGTNHPLTIRILNASTNAVIIEKTTATPTSSTYINTDSPLSLGDVNVNFKIQLYAPSGKGIRLRNYSITGTPAGGGTPTPTTYTVTYNANGGTGAMTDSNSPYQANDEVTLLANTFTAPDGKVWDSWSVKDASSNDITVSNGKFTMPASNVTVSAQWVDDPNAPQYEWVETSLADLTSSDVFVIVGTVSNSSYSMSNNSTSNPAASSVTIESGKITSAVNDNIKWNISGNATDGYTFYPNGSTTTWLYCNTTASSGSNTNLRVGTGTNPRKLFIADGTTLKTKDTNTARYWNVYSSGSDWRGYTSNSTSTTVKFYKRQVPTNDPSIYASDPEMLAYDAASGEFGYSITNPTSATLTATSNSDWITDVVVDGTNSKVTFSTTANPNTTQRTGSITLSYTGAENKMVTITQAAAPVIYTTIPALFEKATEVGSTATVVNVTFGGWVVSAVKGSNAYLTDNQGYGLIIYASSHGFQVNDVLTGTVSCKLQLYRGSAELTELTSSTTGLTVTPNGTVTEQTIAISGLSGVNTGALLSFEGLTYNDTALDDGNNNTITPFNTLYSEMSFESGKSYDVTGIYLQYNTTKEILPRSSDDIEEVQVQHQDYDLTVTLDSNVSAIYVFNADDQSNPLITDGAAGTVQVADATQVLVSPYVESGYILGSLTVGGEDVTSQMVDGSYTFYMPKQAVAITATAVPVTTYTLASSITSGKHYIIVNNDAKRAMGEQGNNNRAAAEVKIDGQTASVVSNAGVAEFVIYGPDAKGSYTIYDAAYNNNEGGYLYAASNSSNQLKTQATNNDNGRWSISFGEGGVASIVAQCDNSHNVMQYNSSSSLFACYTSASQQPVYLYEKAGEATPTESVTVGSAGYATFASNNALDFTGKDIKAFYATVSGDVLSFTQIYKVPANTGVLLYKDGGTTENIPALTGAANDVANNVFVQGKDEAVSYAANDQNYILFNGEDGLGFYRAANNTVATNRAYIHIEGGAGVKSFAINFDAIVDGITNIAKSQEPMVDAQIFNLAGQRMSKMQKGINIVNGKKVLVK